MRGRGGGQWRARGREASAATRRRRLRSRSRRGARGRSRSAAARRQRHDGAPLPLVVRRRRAQLRLGLVRGLPALRRRKKSAAVAAAADRAARRAIHNHRSTHDDRGVRRLRLHQRVPRQAGVGGRRLLRRRRPRLGLEQMRRRRGRHRLRRLRRLVPHAEAAGRVADARAVQRAASELFTHAAILLGAPRLDVVVARAQQLAHLDTVLLQLRKGPGGAAANLLVLTLCLHQVEEVGWALVGHRVEQPRLALERRQPLVPQLFFGGHGQRRGWRGPGLLG